ncbi:MAG: hypothetical protein ACLFUV_03255 [Methanomassiliicoccales archaeon]
MNTDLLVAGAAGFGPAIIIMYYTLKDYTYPVVERPFFDDRKAFGIFTIGLVIGTVVFAAQTWVSLEVLLVALGFAAMEELLKLVVLNLPRFQGKLDTSFYGLSLGLGMGATMGFGAFYLTIGQVDQLAGGSIVLLSLIGLQFVLLHASTGATIGVGVARGSPWEYFAQAAIVHLGYNLLMIPFYQNQWYSLVFFALATVILAAYYLHVYRRMIPTLVEEGISSLESGSKG